MRLRDLVSCRTGKLNSNAACDNGEYPFFTCSQETYRTNTYSFDCEAVLLGGNNANGVYPLKYFRGKFDAYQRTYVICTKDENILLNRYLYYALRTKLSLLQSYSSGVTTKFLTLVILHNIDLEVPTKISQEKIIKILSAYDDLIENNTRRIQILEEMAQRIYREWFVNFHFPGYEKVKFVDSELRRIPEGWEALSMGDILRTIESGSRPKGGIDPNETGIPSIGAENILGLGKYEFDKEKYVSVEFFKGIRKGKIGSGDVLLYKDGAKIGRKSMFRDDFPHEVCCINEHVFILRTNSRCSQNYLYFYLDRSDVTKMIISLNANAAQPGINQTGVKSLSILLPKRELIVLFDEQVNSLLALLFNLAKKNQLLRKKRDLLLPKLISSKIDVENMDIISARDTNENT
jgi:type I restriction enzyme S subunit